MAKVVKLRVTEGRTVAAGAGEGAGELAANGDRVLVVEDEKSWGRVVGMAAQQHKNTQSHKIVHFKWLKFSTICILRNKRRSISFTSQMVSHPVLVSFTAFYSLWGLCRTFALVSLPQCSSRHPQPDPL